jgi:hypothetical protein
LGPIKYCSRSGTYLATRRCEACDSNGHLTSLTSSRIPAVLRRLGTALCSGKDRAKCSSGANMSPKRRRNAMRSPKWKLCYKKTGRRRGNSVCLWATEKERGGIARVSASGKGHLSVACLSSESQNVPPVRVTEPVTMASAAQPAKELVRFPKDGKFRRNLAVK